MLSRYLLNFHIALEGILSNKLRSFLTALGIIFGVAAVIAMMAIGNGAKQEILDQMKLVGVNNIVITPVFEQKEDLVEEASKNDKKKFSPGLNLADLSSILSILPNIERSSPEIVFDTPIIKDGLRRTAKLVGIEPDYFEISNFKLEQGIIFNQQQIINGEQVCVIGKGIQTKFFSKENPIGKYIKCGSVWLKVVGVLEERVITESSISRLGIRNYNMDVYTPVKTLLIRFKNRSLITKANIQLASKDDEEDKAEAPKSTNYHQLDKIIVQVGNSEDMQTTAEIISRLLERRHYKVIDFEISIPEVMLKQQQRNKEIFDIVLGAIAGISLLVGGIGIMNIMLASVLERIKEIGLRLSIGATKKDVVLQFLMESVMISLSGGIVGVISGVALAVIISKTFDIPTIISAFSIIISFSVSAIIGLVFGIAPAKRAAEQDPINSLRHE
ncbi:MAG: ABC transporter permease [Bacteroidota bacterium]|nr:ABC transporter permease [Bacteroidota bacterium]